MQLSPKKSILKRSSSQSSETTPSPSRTGSTIFKYLKKRPSTSTVKNSKMEEYGKVINAKTESNSNTGAPPNSDRCVRFAFPERTLEFETPAPIVDDALKAADLKPEWTPKKLLSYYQDSCQVHEYEPIPKLERQLESATEAPVFLDLSGTCNPQRSEQSLISQAQRLTRPILIHSLICCAWISA